GARRLRSAGEERADLVPPGLESQLGSLESAARDRASSYLEEAAAHDPGGPDVAVEAALVSYAVHEARLGEKLVEGRPVLRGQALAHRDGVGRSGDAPVRGSAVDRTPDGREEHLGGLGVGELAEVEPVLQPVRDHVQPTPSRGPELSLGGAQTGDRFARGL